MARISTTLGDIELELYPESAPATVQNFIDYINSGHFDELIFHRVIPGFVIQGGGFTADMQQRDTRAPIQNEADNGLKNERGTLSMARTNDPHSATSQFFINLADNAFLDHNAKNPSGWGYAVFARVTGGMDVVDKIAAVPTTTVGPFADVPSKPVVITEAKILPRG
ncbi:MAG: peptidylprolyl isomerase [Gammaproteobacteria bacterium]|nr:peptidylprolyl isomerase [Gammaproteobacteria bacterium]